MTVQHKHLIARVELTDFFLVDEAKDFKKWQIDLIKKMDMKIMSGPHQVYVNREGLEGWCGATLIETSSTTYHVWDKKNPILLQLDVFTCGDLDPTIVFEFLLKFAPKKIDYAIYDREHRLDIIEEGLLIGLEEIILFIDRKRNGNNSKVQS